MEITQLRSSCLQNSHWTRCQPPNDAVQFSSVPPQSIAVIRYAGYFNGDRISKAKQRLSVWLDKEEFEPESDFIVAGYYPLWVPGFLAWNEVMIVIKI
jgi:hypothetical protein